MWLKKKRNSEVSLGFIVPIKSTIATEGEKKRRKKKEKEKMKKKNPKDSTEQVKT